jgi:hypothetical protein
MTRPDTVSLMGSTGLAALAQGLWVWSWLSASGAPALPAAAVWAWPMVWVTCGLGAWGLSALATRWTQPGTQGAPLAAGMLSELLSRVLLLGVPLLMCFFAGLSVLASASTS